MYTRFIENPSCPGVCKHNTRNYQVTELMGGLAVELLKKDRTVGCDAEWMREYSMSLHDCFPSVFMQGDDASYFLAELHEANSKLTPAQIDQLFLSGYDPVLQT